MIGDGLLAVHLSHFERCFLSDPGVAHLEYVHEADLGLRSNGNRNSGDPTSLKRARLSLTDHALQSAARCGIRHLSRYEDLNEVEKSREVYTEDMEWEAPVTEHPEGLARGKARIPERR